MDADAESLRLGPAVAMRLPLPAAAAGRKALVRLLLLASCGAVRVEGIGRLARAPRPAIFALSHHGAWETVLAPATLVALRGGGALRFFVDWMYTELPWIGWLVRRIDPIPVWRKRARFGWKEGLRRAQARRNPLAEAVATLAAGTDVGLYPEGRRNHDSIRLAPLRPGVARLTLATGAPIVPVGVELPARTRLGRPPRVGRIVLRIGEPLPFDDMRVAATAGPVARRSAERRITARVAAVLAELSRKLPAAPGEPRKEPEMSSSFVPRASRAAITVAPVTSSAQRGEAAAVIAEVYRDEKRWIADERRELELDAATGERVIWLLARAGDQPVGVLRLVVDPELALPEGCGLRLEKGVDLVQLGGSGRFADVGRLMVRSAWRRQPAIVLALMRAALETVIERRCTHLLTTVFEDDQHSPYRFHMRQLGFQRIGTFERGELACASRRILLAVDLADAWARLGAGRRGVAAALGAGLAARLVAVS